MNKKVLFIKIFLFIYVLLIIVNIGFFVYAYITPKFQINTKSNIILYDINDEEMFSDNEFKNYVKLDEISDNVINAIISVEDKNFYNHQGFDILRIIKALYTNIVNKKIMQGASTISQQYIKNLFLDFDQTWKRKIEEAYLTYELEVHYEKNEILEGYLNTIDFGAGNYGIYQASKYYFNKHPSELSLAESSIIVGIPKNPSYYNPISNYEAAKERQLTVLNSMVENKYITEKDKEDAYNEELNFYAINDKKQLSSLYYYKDAVLNELYNIDGIPSSLLDLNGLKIYTNLEKNAQLTLENNINEFMSDTTMQVASVIIKPDTGKIIALIGGKDYTTSQFNRVTSSTRQVGSTIKPFLYYAALENGFTSSTTFLSEQTTFNLGTELYSPKNAGNIYANTNISLLAAIAYSDNIYAMKTHLFLGPDKLGTITNRAGIETPVLDNASSALGTTEINMLDYANGYITLANMGVHTKPYLIRKITDLEGNVLYEHEIEEKYVLNEKYVYILNNLLTSTYDYSMVNYTSPTLISVNNIIDGEKYAVKSGSTSTDYLTIGYNNDYLVMVWNGNDDNSAVKNSESRISKKIWANTIVDLPKSDNSWYSIPKGIIGTIVDPINGKVNLESNQVCYYEKGTEPSYNFENLFDIIKEEN